MEIATRRCPRLRVVWDLRERAHPLTKTQAMEPSRQSWSSYGPPYPLGHWFGALGVESCDIKLGRVVLRRANELVAFFRKGYLFVHCTKYRVQSCFEISTKKKKRYVRRKHLQNEKKWEWRKKGHPSYVFFITLMIRTTPPIFLFPTLKNRAQKLDWRWDVVFLSGTKA